MNNETARHGLHRRAAATLCVVVLLGTTVSGRAQIIENDPPRAGQSFIYLNWNLTGDSTDASISEWVLPVTGMIPLGASAELRYFTALAGATSSARTFDRDLSGLTDSRIQLSHALANDRLLVSVGVNLPTGKKKLDGDQFEVLRILSDEYFNFPLKTFGEGVNVYTEMLGAAVLGDWMVGGGFGLSYNGAYEPTDNGISYHPGLRFYLTGSAQIELDELDAGHLRFDGVLTYAAVDKADDKDIFKDGPWIDLSASGTRRFGEWLGGANARLILRMKDERVIDGGNLVADEYASSGSEVRLRFHAARELTDRLTGLVDVSAKLLGTNNFPVESVYFEGGASLFGLGGQLTGRLSDRTHAAFGLRKWFGTTKEGGRTEALDLSGWEIRQNITVTF